MVNKFLRKTVIAFSIIAIFTLTAAQVVPKDRYFQILKNLDIFATLYKEVNNYYVEDLNPSTMMNIAIDKMLESLDPYTNYIPAEKIENYRMANTGEYSGIGAAVESIDSISTVIMPYKGFSAYNAGLRAGDQILKIGDINIKGKTHDEVRTLLKGQSNAEITLTVKRPNNPKPYEVKLKREKIATGSVPYSGMVTDDIGYVRLTSFTPNVGRQIGVKTMDLIEKGAKKIILDLRGNPGGLLHEAVNVSNVFIEKGKKIVTQKGKLKSNDWVYHTLNDAVDTQIPLVVLINENSASASEIVSGVVQDYDRGVLVGRKSYGKGLVQIERPLSYDAMVKITTAKYYTPSGRCIQAIDYSKKKMDGSVGKIADSLKNEFKTSKGRSVFDGGGVDPDIKVASPKYGMITRALQKNRYVFKYVNKLYYNTPEASKPKSAKEVKISDADYDKFVNWVVNKKLDYGSKLNKKVKALADFAKKDTKQYGNLQSQIQALYEKSLPNKREDLTKYKKEIKILMEQELAARYFMEKGIVESVFDDDPDILKAVEILNNPVAYKKIIKAE